MIIISWLVDFVLHIDKNLALIIQNYGTLSYLLLFLIIFCEVGLVVTPFLPGDSLIFAAGALASKGILNIFLLFSLFFLAAFFGNILNYSIGRYIGDKIHRRINSDYIARTHKFYEKHGGLAIVLARFMPIIRTFAPFVAGLGKMSFLKFVSFSLIGAFLWVSLFVFSGFYFGNIPLISNHFSLVVIAIVIISLIPAIIEYLRHRKD